MTATHKEVIGGGSAIHTWTGLACGEAGIGIEASAKTWKSVQAVGDFNSQTLTMQGSNDGINWFTLQDAGGNNVTFTADGGKQIATPSRYVRPSFGGSSGGLINVILCDPRR